MEQETSVGTRFSRLEDGIKGTIDSGLRRLGHWWQIFSLLLEQITSLPWTYMYVRSYVLRLIVGPSIPRILQHPCRQSFWTADVDEIYHVSNTGLQECSSRIA